MTNRNATQAIAAVLAVAVAAPLSASARHHRSEDILAGVVIGAIAGTFVAAAASGNVEYIPAPAVGCYYPPPSPPPCYGRPGPPPPRYYGAPAYSRRHYRHNPPPSPFYGHRPPRPPRH